MQHTMREIKLCIAEIEMRKLRKKETTKKHPHLFKCEVYTVPKGAQEREVLWIMNDQHCTTDALLFGVVQSGGILLILRKRLAGSFPVY